MWRQISASVLLPLIKLTMPFQRVLVEPDKEAIRTALEAGEVLGFAFLAPKDNHLRIR